MQLGIHLGTFRQPTLEATLDAVCGHGLVCVHFNFKAVGLPSMPEHVDDAFCEHVAREAAARGITIATLSGTFNMIHPDREVRRKGLRRLEGIAAAARPLGTKVVALCTGTRDPDDMWRTHPDNNTPQAWSDLVDSMGTALRIAKKHNVTLAIEPAVSNVVDSAARARQLPDTMHSPRLKVIMDGANLFGTGMLGQMGEVLDQAFELLGPDIVAGHAKDLDADGAAGQLAAGRGRLDYTRYLGLFQKVGFHGPLILHGLDASEVPDSVAFVRAKLAAIAPTC